MLPENNNANIKPLSDLQNDYLHDAICNMSLNNIHLVDKTHGDKGIHINVSHYFPTLALIFKAMLLCALQERAQKITIEFNDCTAYTTITYP